MPPAVLLGCEAVSKAYGSHPLFSGITLSIREGDHVGLVGPNGAGKSTLLRILAGDETPDSGQVTTRKAIRVGYVPQDPVFAPGRTVEQVLLESFTRGEHDEEHELATTVMLVLARTGFEDPDLRTEALSGGWRKRLAIARALAAEPDVLLLDEPTNHLDVAGILWLEQLLRSEPKAFVAVSHDRWFLENVAKRMLELDKVHAAGVFEAEGSYSDFLEKREERLASDAAERETLANLARRELEWLRRGPKARTSKSKARIDAAGELFDALADSRQRAVTRSASIDFLATDRKTKRLLEVKNVSKSLGGRVLVRDLHFLLSPGMRLGILGPNGSGKTTILRMLTGELAPDSGEIARADRLRTVYFEQNRESLEPDLTLRRALAPDGDSVIFGDRSIHVASWAKKFLFRPDQLDAEISRLSGGEKARVVLARLMLRPADLLVMDEPTNDLDIPTLDVLEESLMEFPGALVLVTHDRWMLERVSTGLLALDGEGNTGAFADYLQWEDSTRRRSGGKKGSGKGRREPEKGAAPPPSPPAAKKKRKLPFAEQREWDGLPARITGAESAVAAAAARLAEPSIASVAAELTSRSRALAAAEAELERLYERWAELERKQAG